MNFAEALKLIRESKGVSQRELADALGVHRSAISGYETRGQSPSIEKLIQIADYLDVTIDALVGRTIERKHLSVRRTKKTEEIYNAVQLVKGNEASRTLLLRLKGLTQTDRKVLIYIMEHFIKLREEQNEEKENDIK